MKKRLSFYFILALLVCTVSSCSSEDEITTEEIPTKSLTVECNVISEKSFNAQSTPNFPLKLTVYDKSTGYPIVGAIVKVKGSLYNAAMTDNNGQCAIIVKLGDILVIQYLGYRPQEFKVIMIVPGIVRLIPNEDLD